jgi:hypothetical protein
MLWLLVGVVIGFAWHWLLVWSRAKGFRISWLAWILLVLTLVAGLSGAQNYIGLMQEYEEHAAGMMIPVYGLQTVIPGLLSILVLWLQARKARA